MVNFEYGIYFNGVQLPSFVIVKSIENYLTALWEKHKMKVETR